LSVRAGLICAVLVVVAGCGGGDDGEDAGSSTSPSKRYENPPMHARVEITSKGYKPRHVRILLGGTVTFVNVDRTSPHTAETANLPEGLSDNNEFDTHSLSWEEPYTITFHKPETIDYFDSFSEMKGTVEAVAKVPPEDLAKIPPLE
jgi:plastocyanin